MLTKEQFEALSPEERRVAVAKDVMQERDAWRFTVESGTWLGADVNVSWTQAELTSGRVVCYGCALGGLMYSVIRLGNAFCSARCDFIPITGFKHRLEDVFSDDQLECIEVAFELGEGGFTKNGYEEDGGVPDWFLPAVDFGKRFTHDGERFSAIMHNIVDNNGEFVP